jgi:hypothetical protein
MMSTPCRSSIPQCLAALLIFSLFIISPASVASSPKDQPATGAAAMSLNGSSLFLEAPEYGTGQPEGYQVAVADFNLDGIPDAVVANGCKGCANGTVGVLLGIGDGTFQPAVTYNSGGVGPIAVAAGDVNGDGKPDVVVVNSCVSSTNCSTSTVAVLLGNGDGTFQPAVTYGSGGEGSFGMAVADVNGDGKLDVLVAIYTSSAGNVAVLLGNGDGTFQPAVLYGTGGHDLSVIVSDVNGDGKPDLIVPNYCSILSDGICESGSVGVLLGRGDGTFEPVVNYPIPALSFSLSVGDVNGDGKPDIVAATGYSVQLLLGNGDGTFQSAAIVNGTYGWSQLRYISLADVNGDGKLDILVDDLNDVFGGALLVMLGNGDGTFQPITAFSSIGTNPRFFAVTDVNSDGKPDVLVANQCASGTTINTCTEGSLAVLLGNGDGTFVTAQDYNANAPTGFVVSLAAGDLNGDGKADLVAAYPCNVTYQCTQGILDVLLNNGNGTFGAPMPTVFVAPATAVAIADVNGDGKPDLLVGTGCTESNTYYCSSEYTAFPNGYAAELLGNGDGTFRSGPNIPQTGGIVVTSIAVVDVNGDGKPDLLVATSCATTDCVTSGGTVSVLLGNGDGTFQTPLTYNSGGIDAVSLAVSDVNGDGHPDLIVTNSGCTNGDCGWPSVVSVLLGNGDGTFKPAVNYATGGQVPVAVVVGDINGDGIPDLVVGNSACNPACGNANVAVLFGNGDGTFQTPLTTSVPGLSGGSLVLADFDGDGKLDVAAASEQNYGDFILFGNGDGTFQPSVPVASTWPGVVAADLTGQGKTSLVFGGTLSVLLNNRPPSTTTTLISSASPSYLNQTVTFTATVSGQGTTPTGTVTFHISLNHPVTVPLVNGQATYSWTFGKTGPRTVTARYSGDANHAPSSSNVLSQLVNSPFLTQTSVTSSLDPSRVDQPVTYTATVASQGGPTPTGTVTFTINGNKPVAVALTNGQATFNWTYLHAGARTVTASYSGDAAHQPSTSAMLNQTISPQATKTSLTSSLNPSNINQTVTFTASVAGQNGGTPTGTVTFTISGNKPISMALTNGQTQFSWTFLHAGPRTVTASYSGDANDQGSASAALNQTVNP